MKQKSKLLLLPIMSLLLVGCGGEIEPSSSFESSEPEVSSSAESSSSASHSSNFSFTLKLYGSNLKESGDDFTITTSHQIFEFRFEKNEAETALVNGESYFELPAKAKFSVTMLKEGYTLLDSVTDVLGSVTNSSITFAEAVDVSALNLQNATGVGTTEVVLTYSENATSFSFVPNVAVKLVSMNFCYGSN